MLNILLPQVIYALFCIFFAYANYRVIEVLNQKIRHGINGIFGIVTSIYFFTQHWEIGLSILFIGRLFFDSSLSLFRGKKLGYVSPNPISIIDRVEKRIFGNNGLLPKITYLIIIILLNIWLIER